MKKFILMFFLLFLLSGSIVYAATWSEAGSPAGGTNRNWISLDVNFVGNETAIAGTENGRLYRYTSSGWAETRPAGDIDAEWRLVAAGGSYMLAGQYNGRLYKSDDSGQSWEEIQPAGNVNENWSTGLINSSGTRILAAASGGRVYLSTNGGDSWSEVQPAGDNDRDWTNMSWNNTSLTVMICANGIGGRVYRSTNFGSNWSEVQPAGDSDYDWSTCQVGSSADLYVVAVDGGRVYKSTDASSWSEIQPAGNTDQGWRSSKVGDSGRILIAASPGRIYYSTDSGDNWNQEQPAGDTNGNWRALDMSGNGTTMYAAAYGGRLYSTNSPSPTSSPTPTPTSSGSSSSSSNSSSSGGGGCQATQITATPDLFRIDPAGTYVNVYFTTVNGADSYNITYGFTNAVNQYGDSFNYGGAAWIQGRTISSLNPNTTYYFRVAGANCAGSSPWSKIVSVKTGSRFSNITQWFANLNPFNAPIPVNTSKSISTKPTSSKAITKKSKNAAVASSQIDECTYTFSHGESLFGIARWKLGTWRRVDKILELNPGLDPKNMRHGQKIKIC